VSRVVLVFVCLLGAALVGGCGGGGGSPDIAFVSTRDGDYAIYTMTATGGSEQRVSETQSELKVLFLQIDPAWSPDGTKLAYSGRESGNFDIYVMASDGTGVKRLTSTKDNDTHPSWSPDGKQIVFARGSDLFVMRADGSDVHQISVLGEKADPSWSPDGKWIAFTLRTAGTDVRELWIMRPDGSGRHRLTNQNARIFTPAWSPDSSRIAFASNKGGTLFALYTIGVDGKKPRSVVPTANDNFEPSWSPDGTKIAYQEEGAIYTVELGGGDVQRLTSSDTNDSQPAWNAAVVRQ
jgi:TolB protein